ncbi:C6 finger domain-containingprotein [Purpureocillium lavendulum]|uniref:C6 finger domain-containingprotein n=1 Tax=Purpureocillium lavendulum TaxID=1247861 RepID=A0AB34FNU0_9HYPO|nr:C6 finger domain-containingprotein [Purpureocillium lavendulum]
MATSSFFSSGPDERRPTCERCEKGYHRRVGYEKPQVFVNKGVGMSHSITTIARGRKVTPESESSGSTSGSDRSSGFVDKTAGSIGCVKPMLKLDGFKDDIVISHLIAKLATVGYKFSKGTDAPTMAGVLMGSNGQSVAYIAGLSLAEAFFGRIHKIQGMVDHSVSLYGQALRSLREVLKLLDQRAGRSRTYMNLWSTNFLGMYEMVSSGGSSN